jgi:hypothetical protein
MAMALPTQLSLRHNMTKSHSRDPNVHNSILVWRVSVPAGCFQTTRQPEAVVAVAVAVVVVIVVVVVVAVAVVSVVVMDCWNPPRYQIPSLPGNITC